MDTIKGFLMGGLLVCILAIVCYKNTPIKIRDWSIREGIMQDFEYFGRVSDIRIEDNQLKIYDGDTLLVQQNLDLLLEK